MINRSVPISITGLVYSGPAPGRLAAGSADDMGLPADFYAPHQKRRGYQPSCRPARRDPPKRHSRQAVHLTAGYPNYIIRHSLIVSGCLRRLLTAMSE
jgi:hypothetical protein